MIKILKKFHKMLDFKLEAIAPPREALNAAFLSTAFALLPVPAEMIRQLD